MAKFDKRLENRILLEPRKVSENEEDTDDVEFVIDDGTHPIPVDGNDKDNIYYIEIVNNIIDTHTVSGSCPARGIIANVYNTNKVNIGNNKVIDCFLGQQAINFEKGKTYKVEMSEVGDCYVFNRVIK